MELSPRRSAGSTGRSAAVWPVAHAHEAGASTRPPGLRRRCGAGAHRVAARRDGGLDRAGCRPGCGCVGRRFGRVRLVHAAPSKARSARRSARWWPARQRLHRLSVTQALGGGGVRRRRRWPSCLPGGSTTTWPSRWWRPWVWWWRRRCSDLRVEPGRAGCMCTGGPQPSVRAHPEGPRHGFVR